MKLPGPREQLAGCVWLPRILAKARLFKHGALAPDYAARFCHPTGVDGHFLSHFGLTREDIFAVAELLESEVPAWLSSRAKAEHIQAWNRIAVNLGQPDFPMAERFPVALATAYKHIDSRRMSTVFEVLEEDEKGAS